MTARELFADSLMLAHACFAVFVLYGLVFILAGTIVDWPWTRNRWFRGLNLAGTLFLLARVWLGVPCPFSIAEDQLRSRITVPCPLGDLTHAIFHQLAFRGNDPHGFARWTTIFGIVAILIHLVAALRSRKMQQASSSICKNVSKTGVSADASPR
jgi:hypothetical protein